MPYGIANACAPYTKLILAKTLEIAKGRCCVDRWCGTHVTVGCGGRCASGSMSAGKVNLAGLPLDAAVPSGKSKTVALLAKVELANVEFVAVESTGTSTTSVTSKAGRSRCVTPTSGMTTTRGCPTSRSAFSVFMCLTSAHWRGARISINEVC